MDKVSRNQNIPNEIILCFLNKKIAAAIIARIARKLRIVRKSKKLLDIGKSIYQVLSQPPEERHSLVAQQLMLETVLLSEGGDSIDVAGLKEEVKQVSQKVKEEKDFDSIEAELLKKFAKKVVVEKLPEEKSETGESPEIVAKEKKDA